MTLTKESEALLDRIESLNSRSFSLVFPRDLAAIEAAARADIAARVETEWVNGNLSDDVRDRILGDAR